MVWNEEALGYELMYIIPIQEVSTCRITKANSYEIEIVDNVFKREWERKNEIV